jgi:hypothetical protein
MRTIWLIPATLMAIAAAAGPTAGQDGKPAVKKEDLRYDGKTFAEWRDYLHTELKAERRIDGLRAMAAFGVRGYGEEAAEAVLLLGEDKLLHDHMDEPDVVLYQKANSTLLLLGESIATLIAKQVQHSDRRVREQAWGRLGRSPVREAINRDASASALLRMIRDGSPDSADAAMLVLPFCTDFAGTVEDDKTVTAVVMSAKRLLSKEAVANGPDYPSTAIYVLAAIESRTPVAVPVLAEAFQRSPQYRINIVEALGNIGPPAKAALPLLHRALQSREPEVRQAAEAAISKIRLKRPVPLEPPTVPQTRPF